MDKKSLNINRLKAVSRIVKENLTISYSISVYVTVFCFHFGALSKGCSFKWVLGLFKWIFTTDSSTQKDGMNSSFRCMGSLWRTRLLSVSALPISAYFFHRDLQVVHRVHTNWLPDWEQATAWQNFFLLTHLTAKKLIPIYFTLVEILSFLLTGQTGSVSTSFSQ